ncbi:Arm DNA-binding domain-containing protein [Paenibacillus apiarius]|uniref:Arm DNA-binding domain-containing protein n=1 Tax=Paenibacillus apiarius TaxID=46240 RepID=UPI003B3B859B
MASIQKRGDEWKYEVNFTEDGKRKRVSRSGFKTKKEAARAAFEVELSLRSQRRE